MRWPRSLLTLHSVVTVNWRVQVRLLFRTEHCKRLPCIDRPETAASLSPPRSQKAQSIPGTVASRSLAQPGCVVNDPSTTHLSFTLWVRFPSSHRTRADGSFRAEQLTEISLSIFLSVITSSYPCVPKLRAVSASLKCASGSSCPKTSKVSSKRWQRCRSNCLPLMYGNICWHVWYRQATDHQSRPASGARRHCAGRY